MTEPPKVLEDVFERAGLAPHETKYSRWSVTVSADPRGGDSDQTRGSKVKMCAACGSNNTRCVHSDGMHGKEQWTATELLCSDCGAYSWWAWEAW